jgi:twitching motility protein PilJ
MALKLKLPFGKAGATKAKPAAAAPKSASIFSGGLPLIGHLRTGLQLQILGGLMAFVLLVAAIVVVTDTRQGTFGTIYIASVGKIRMLSQRLAKAAQLASRGSEEAFKELRASREEFVGLIKLLDAGGDAGGVTLPATSGAMRPALDALNAEWSKTDRNAGLVLDEEKNLVALGNAVRTINNTNQAARNTDDLCDQRAERRLGAPERHRLAADDDHAAHGEREHDARRSVVNPEVAFLLSRTPIPSATR